MLRNIETTRSSRGLNYDEQNHEEVQFRDIHALTPTPTPTPIAAPNRGSSNLSVASDVTNSSENFSSMSREFNALVLAGSNIIDDDHQDHPDIHANTPNLLDRIREEDEDTNPLAIVPDHNPLPLPGLGDYGHPNNNNNNNNYIMSSTTNNNTSVVAAGDIGVHKVMKEEVDAKITAWETAKISKINNRFKREDAIISGWENEQVHKASTWMKIVERKLEEKRAKAMEKMQNDIAKAHRRAEERRASAEGKRGIKVAKVVQVSNLMRAVGRPPAKRSFF